MLSPAFGGMTAFIKETEPLLERGQGQVIRPDERMYSLVPPVSYINYFLIVDVDLLKWLFQRKNLKVSFLLEKVQHGRSKRGGQLNQIYNFRKTFSSQKS